MYFHKPDVFLVVDTLVSKDGKEHEYDLRWHLDSTEITTRSNGKIVATADAGQANLEVVPLFHDGLEVRRTSGQMEPEILGWNAALSDSPKPATTVQHLKRGEGTVQFLTLLLPLKPGESSRLRRAAQIDASTLEIELEDGRKLRVEVPADPWEKLRVRGG